jgi:hypothetical protein
MRHCQSHFVQSVLLSAQSQQLLEVFVVDKVLKINYLSFLNKSMEDLIVLYYL